MSYKFPIRMLEYLALILAVLVLLKDPLVASPLQHTQNTARPSLTSPSIINQNITSVALSPLAQKLQQANLHRQLKNIHKAIVGYVDIVIDHSISGIDQKIQDKALAALVGLQKKRARDGLKKYLLEVTSTAYSSHVNQTDSTPWIAAWGDRLKDGMKIIAVSNDLLKMGLTRGSRVKIHGIDGVFVVLDKMNRRWTKRIDIYMGGNLQAARAWGMRTHHITFLTGIDLKVDPAISKKHYNQYYAASKKKLTPLQKALASLKVRCNRQRPSCKKWVFLKRKKILRRFSKR